MEPDGGHRGQGLQDQADKSCSPSIQTTGSSRVKKGSVSQGVVPAGWGLEPQEGSVGDTQDWSRMT